MRTGCSGWLTRRWPAMPDETEGFEPDVGRPSAADLSLARSARGGVVRGGEVVLPADASVDAAVTRWTCGHAELAAALHRTRQCRWMNDPALATMAREILAQLPEAGPDQSAEIARLKTERAEMTGQLIMAKEGVWGS